MVIHIFNPRILEAEASTDRSLQIPGQLGVCSKSLSQKIKNSIITIWDWWHVLVTSAFRTVQENCYKSQVGLCYHLSTSMSIIISANQPSGKLGHLCSLTHSQDCSAACNSNGIIFSETELVHHSPTSDPLFLAFAQNITGVYLHTHVSFSRNTHLEICTCNDFLLI